MAPWMQQQAMVLDSVQCSTLVSLSTILRRKYDSTLGPGGGYSFNVTKYLVAFLVPRIAAHQSDSGRSNVQPTFFLPVVFPQAARHPACCSLPPLLTLLAAVVRVAPTPFPTSFLVPDVLLLVVLMIW